MRGHLIVFEGLDQSGKQTQAARLCDRLVALGRDVRLIAFPDYDTHIGGEIARALAGGREYDADVMQLLYVANRYEWRPVIERLLAGGAIIVSDRYLASSVAYGEAFGLDRGWLLAIQQFLPAPSMTIMLDIAPATAVTRKATGRDRFERDLALQARVRESYTRLAAEQQWVVLPGERSKDDIATDVFTAVALRLGLPG
jgi:dTMP kinase